MNQEPEKTLLPWLDTGRDRSLMKKDDLDVKLFVFAGHDKYAYYYHFGQALRDHISRLFPSHKHELRVSPAMLFERACEVFDRLDYRTLRKMGYETNIRASFFQDAVSRYLEGKIEKS